MHERLASGISSPGISKKKSFPPRANGITLLPTWKAPGILAKGAEATSSTDSSAFSFANFKEKAWILFGDRGEISLKIMLTKRDRALYFNGIDRYDGQGVFFTDSSPNLC